MSRRLKIALQYSLIFAVMMTVVGYVLGSEFYWQGVIGSALGGFTIGYFIFPYIERKKDKAT